MRRRPARRRRESRDLLDVRRSDLSASRDFSSSRTRTATHVRHCWKAAKHKARIRQQRHRNVTAGSTATSAHVSRVQVHAPRRPSDVHHVFVLALAACPAKVCPHREVPCHAHGRVGSQPRCARRCPAAGSPLHGPTGPVYSPTGPRTHTHNRQTRAHIDKLDGTPPANITPVEFSTSMHANMYVTWGRALGRGCRGSLTLGIQPSSLAESAA